MSEIVAHDAVIDRVNSVEDLILLIVGYAFYASVQLYRLKEVAVPVKEQQFGGGIVLIRLTEAVITCIICYHKEGFRCGKILEMRNAFSGNRYGSVFFLKIRRFNSGQVIIIRG